MQILPVCRVFLFKIMKKESFEVPTKKSSYTKVGRLDLTIISEVYCGEIMDTTIFIEGGVLCTVSGDNRIKFIRKFQKLVNKYSI